ncbi:hypothetical protein [Oceanirhabdus sp. W0125-5]|uniref:hypothetical protein n=1 Tax=Oceanirhabdus sp. W0125-5 TaxID=2999116 RepID=UPI0022F2B30F|nr:hypothetical protein [Oceanirhabdus sp. W0125-5]WBW98084.1 hypothetical protein OW730_04780 [Oceanirhabdus sp. W0125-5]
MVTNGYKVVTCTCEFIWFYLIKKNVLISNFVTKSNDEEGIVYALQRYLSI